MAKAEHQNAENVGATVEPVAADAPRQWLHDREHEAACLASLAERGDKQAGRDLRNLYAEPAQ